MNYSQNLKRRETCEDAKHPRTILLVEDDTFVREVTGEILQSVGYVVWSAKDAGEAEEIWRGSGSKIDLLLTDVVLPGETGKVLAAKLRRNRPWLRVLFVTGYAEQCSALEDSGEEYLPKPFSSAALIAQIGKLWDSPELERESMLVGACA